MAKTDAPKLDHFFSAVAARLDLWRDLARAAQAWAARPASRADAALQAACGEALGALLPLEDFQAYPGARVLDAIKERVAGGDVAKLSKRRGRVRARRRGGQPGARDAGNARGAGRQTVLRGAVRDAH